MNKFLANIVPVGLTQSSRLNKEELILFYMWKLITGFETNKNGIQSIRLGINCLETDSPFLIISVK